jgi:hypothetical protein
MLSARDESVEWQRGRECLPALLNARIALGTSPRTPQEIPSLLSSMELHAEWQER